MDDLQGTILFWYLDNEELGTKVVKALVTIFNFFFYLIAYSGELRLVILKYVE
jgi:hypothetical protein